MELLTNPWVIIVIVLSVIVGNIAALKYTANMKFKRQEKKQPPYQQTERQKSNEQKPEQ